MPVSRTDSDRREPANEGSDMLADKTIFDPKVGKEWCKRRSLAVFIWKPHAAR